MKLKFNRELPYIIDRIEFKNIITNKGGRL